MWWWRGAGVAGRQVWGRALCGREQGRVWRKGGRWRMVVGGSLLLVGVQATHHTHAACLREGGFFLDPEDAQLTETQPLEMNEASALTHTSLLKQAGGAAVDAAIQLMHRTLRATLDFSQQHRKQLQEVTDLLEYCTSLLRHPGEHDRLWDLLVEARARSEALKQQIKDLNVMLTYACAAVENIAMAAYISGSEFSASAARQMIDSVKLELTMDDKKTQGLEMQYTQAHLEYIEAAQRVMDETKAVDDGDGNNDETESDDSGQMITSESENHLERTEKREVGENDKIALDDG